MVVCRVGMCGWELTISSFPQILAAARAALLTSHSTIAPLPVACILYLKCQDEMLRARSEVCRALAAYPLVFLPGKNGIFTKTMSETYCGG